MEALMVELDAAFRSLLSWSNRPPSTPVTSGVEPSLLPSGNGRHRREKQRLPSGGDGEHQEKPLRRRTGLQWYERATSLAVACRHHGERVAGFDAKSAAYMDMQLETRRVEAVEMQLETRSGRGAGLFPQQWVLLPHPQIGCRRLVVGSRERYKACWLPLLAKHTQVPVVDGPLVVALDCAWIWCYH